MGPDRERTNEQNHHVEPCQRSAPEHGRADYENVYNTAEQPV
ncbi:MAG: hypothetical protein G01um101456_469 [Parcubacteria group bacterium Gr01-1014_56]|nr:MAG: hypothetical protein G01um101456_469 [Parcubacteria group bacterium Gr01-1014_56]